MTIQLRAPFPYFGGKSTIAAQIWQRFGKTQNYVEPFFGSGAVLLSCPHESGIESINDADGFVSNFWRAVQSDPDAVCSAMDWPVNERDLAARHYWLVTEGRERVAALQGDPLGYDAQVAGWWCWGLCSWIGSGWCSGAGPWQWRDGQWQKRYCSAGQGINRQLPHLGGAGQGINRTDSPGVSEWIHALSDRLRRVRVTCGDWSRVCGPSVTEYNGLTGVFLDPPYSDAAKRTADLYAVDCLAVAHDVRAWAIANGGNKKLRICLAGYDGEHAMPDGWECLAWKAQGGYGNQGDDMGRENAAREVLWFSPHCLAARAAIPDGFRCDGGIGMTIPDRTFRYVAHAEIAAYEATGWRVVADFADCHHGAHAVMMELVAPVESVGDAALRALEEFASRMAGPIAPSTTSTPGESERLHGDDFTEPARADAGGRHGYSVFGGNFPQG